MGIFKRRDNSFRPQVQLRSAESHPFGAINDYVPLRNGEIKLYRAIREAVPVVDAAIIKIIRLTGGFQVVCKDKKAEMELGYFFKDSQCGKRAARDQFFY